MKSAILNSALRHISPMGHLLTLGALALVLGSAKSHSSAADIDWTAGSTTDFDWATAANWSTGVPSSGDNVFLLNPIPNPGFLSNPQAILLSSAQVANSLTAFSSYSLSGGSLSLTAGAIHVTLGESLTLGSQLTGSAGLTLTGGGVLNLTNATNSYTGTTTISNGAIIISDQAALGADTSAIVVTGFNPVLGSTNLRGFGGGSLVLNGLASAINISRDLSLQGAGPVNDRGAALVSSGNNTLSGTVEMGVAYNGTFLNTRIIAADGSLNLTGTVNILGTAGTTVSNFGGVNQAGASFYNITGTLAGTGTLEASGGGTLFLNPTDSSGFSGVIRVSGSAASGQSVVRIDSPGVLGTRTASTTSAVLDLNGGVLAVLMDTPDVEVSNGTNANVYFRASSTIFADHTPNSSVKDQSVAFGNLSYEDGITLTFNSRNGYGMSFTTAPVNGGNGNTVLTNNLQGGALLSFTGNFWSNGENTGSRTMTINGNGNTTINGGIIASAAAFDHVLTKTGTGTLTLLGTTSTLDGAVNVQNGTVAISDWRAITNNGSTVSLGSSATGGGTGVLSVIGNNASLANLTTNKVINLAGTTQGATILANQTGTSPGVVLNANFTATGAGIKTLTLGGSNIGSNTINGVIVDNTGTNKTSLTKIDAGRWVLAGTNTYTGATTISNGILQLKANAATSTIIADTSAITFNATNVYAGGTLEFVGQASVNNVETLGALTPTNGSGTIKLTPGSGGTASLVFASLGAVGGGGSVNIDTPNSSNTVSFTTTAISNNIANAGLYYNGSNFAFVPGAGSAVRAPDYTTDTDFATSTTALTTAKSNEITGAGFSNASVTIDSLRINGSTALNMTGLLTVRTAGTANASGGIIQTGGSGTISGTGVSTGGSGALVINVDGGANTLQLDAPITSTTTGGFTKVGAGTLRLGATNAQTGTISINEGTVRLAGADRLGASAALTIRQDGILELNGVSPATSTNAFNNNGIVRNTSATTDVTFTVGGANGTGTSNGIIEDGGVGKVSVVKIGTGGQSWLGLSTYTGTTTIDSTGIVTINNLADGGSPSGIGASSNAASNLIFTGASATQAYAGLSFAGTTNDSTDRLFTFNGAANGGVRIQSNGVNNATSSWTNTGALAFGANATGNPQGLVLGGASTSDNRFFPVINDNAGAATSVYKADAGVWYLEGTNGYTGATTITAGTLYATDGSSLPTASNLVLSGGNFAGTGTLNRTLGSGSGQLQFTANAAGGFSAGGAPLTVDWGTGAVWGTGPFLGTGALLLNNSGVAKSDVDIISGFEITLGAANVFNATTTAAGTTVTLTSGTTGGLAIGQSLTGNSNIPATATIATITGPTTFTLSSGTGVLAGTSAATTAVVGGYRQVNVGDFTSIGADFGTISGIITGAGNLAKEGAGILNLRGANIYTGQTLVRQGTLVVETLGNSSASGATSVGDSTVGNTDAGAIALGNGGTTGGILEYVGLGETSDRKIRLNTTTGTNQIHADGVGALILTNVANDMTAGAKTLSLRGVSQAGNMITSQLSDNGGTLGIMVDSSAQWILTNPANNYTGTTTVGAGMLGIGDNAALGTGNLDLSNGTSFAYGGDRTIANPVRLVNNGTTGITGDYSLTFSQPLQLLNAANNTAMNNTIAAGKTLTFAGATADSLPANANRTWTLDGSGDTFIDGNFTTSQTASGGLNLTKTGDGVLTLGGSGGGTNNFNRNNATVDLDRGTLRLGADEVIGHGLDSQTVAVAYGSLTLSPELINGDTAIFDLNGHTETINGLTATTDGTAIIDNTSATAASLIFGANNAAVNFGNGTGTYTIQNSGGGALSITKTGTAVVSIPTGVTLSFTGTTTIDGGSMTIASPLNGTTGLYVLNSGTSLALTGGLTSPSTITSVVVENGTTLSLLDGAGSNLNGLTTLQLGSSGGTNSTLNLNVGDLTLAGDNLQTDVLAVAAAGTLSLFTGNTITLNLTDAGLNANQQYVLLDASAIGGGLFGGASPLASLASYILGATPGGFTSIDISTNSTTNQIILTTGNLFTGVSYWNGTSNTTWNVGASNWSQDKAGSTAALSIPGQGTDVIFQSDAATAGAVVTTLEQNFKINSLTFEAGTTVTPTSVTINPGVVTTSRLDIAPQNFTDGIKITAGGPAAATISGGVRIVTNQTWDVADSTSVLSLGSLFGEADVIKSGAGKVTLSAAADATFNSGVTSDITINAGTLEILNSAALGNSVNANLANITVNSASAFYYNGAANSALTGVANNLTLAGGTLSVGGNAGNNYYTGTVNVSADSFINMRGSNSAVLTATQGNVVLSGAVSGSGKLTVDSINSLSSGNQLTGTLYFQADNSTWSGGIDLIRGSIQTQTVTGLGTGDITASAGRIQFVTAGGTTYNLNQNITLDAPGGILELSADASGTPTSDMTVNLNGVITIGSAANANNALRISQASDNFSVFNISNSIVLGNDASLTYQGSAVRPLIITGVISDGGSGYKLAINDELGAWAVTSRTVRLTGANTFSGNISVSEGTLEFDTVTGIGGAASSLGQGSSITMGTGAATLSFIGSTSQSTDRPITTVTGAQTLSANGTGGASITYAGAITVGPTGDGSQLVLTGTAGSAGFITGGITETGDSADLTINGGTWSHQTGTSRIGDVVTLTGASTIFNLDSGLFQVRNDIVVTTGATLNLNGTGTLSFSTLTLSADASLLLRDGGIVNLGANDAVVATDFDRLFLGQDLDGATPTLAMGAFNLTTSRLILGERPALRNGNITGSTGVLSVTGGDIDLYEGLIYAGLASTGTSTFEKFGPGSVTLAGDNTGLASTGITIINEGSLLLDYTTNNNDKIRAASQLEMRGSSLTLTGNAGAATSQTVASFTIGNGGSSVITLNQSSGQDMVLNLNAITRAVNAQDGTIRFVLPAGTQSATNGITTDTLNTIGAGANAILGGWATVNDGTGVYFARNTTNAVDGNIVAATTSAQDAVGSWVTGDNVSDSSGFTGTLSYANINSLRLNAASGSDVVMPNAGVLSIASGGILVTDSVGGTPSITGGTLVSGYTAGTPEIIVTQESTQTFLIGSDIRTNSQLFKSGAGILLLNGNNVYTGLTEIQDGTLQVAGGSAIGDTSLVTLSASRNTTLELLADETIGRLQGGQRATNSDYGIVDIGSNTLTINQSTSTTFAGMFTGSGSIVMNAGNTGNLNMTNISSGFTGTVVVSGGLFQLSGVGQNNASSFTVNKGGAILLDNTGGTRSGARILDTTPIILNSADGTFSGTTIVRGLMIRTDQNAVTNETIGDLIFNSGASYLSGDASGTTGRAAILANNFVRNNNATLDVRARNLGLAASDRNNFRIGTTGNETAFIAGLVGGAGATGTKSISIVPWAVGEKTTTTLADANMGNSLVTYDLTNGLRALDLATEYNTYATAGTTDNTRETLNADLIGLTTKTLNSLVIDNIATTTVNVAGAGVGNTLTNTSGAFLFTVSTGVASTSYSTILGGFDDGIAVGGTNEYIFSVVNPSSAATTAQLTATISSPLISTADITKSGRGTLILSGVNTAGGSTKKTTLNEGILEIADLDNIGGNTGALVFAGGTLRLGAGLTDDISTRTISLLQGGGTIDTNGLNLALANSVGSGIGGLTKTGAGNLTLNAAATYTGNTVVSAGTLAVGANNATGNGGNLTIGAGATLDIGTNNITAGLVTTTGAGPVISGTGTITASTGFAFTNTVDTAVSAVLAGAGGLFKNQTNVLTLSGANTYTGTTEVQSGTLSFDTISTVGGGASALGAPTNSESGIIRMGLTTTATSLTYTGVGSTSDRTVEMQGTTGGVTINGNGTGAVTFGNVQTTTTGNKTLTLRGTSDTSLDNTVGAIKEVGSILSVTKTDANTWVIGGTSNYTGSTTVADGILRMTADQVLTGNLALGAAATAGILDLSSASAQFAALTVLTNSASLTSTAIVGAGKTLTLTGNVTIGSNAAASTTLFTATGGGSFVNTNSGGTFQVGGATGATNTNAVTADFSGLASLSLDLGATGTLRVGDNSGVASGVGASQLILATDFTLTAGTVQVGSSATSTLQQLHLGSATNTIHADTLAIASTGRTSGIVDYFTTTGNLVLRGADGTSPAIINMINSTFSTGANQTADLLVAGHSADILASTVTMVNRSANIGSGTATFTFDEGTLGITTLNMANRNGAGTGGAAATVTLGDSTAPGTPTVSIGAINMAVNTSAGGTVTADLNITGGNVSIGDGLNTGTAINMANTVASRTVTSNINLTGGTVTVTGDIVRTGGAGTENANVTLNGSALDMSSNSIGATGQTITFLAQSGTLKALGELNGGGNLTKTTAGVLVVEGANNYTGATVISGGTLQLGNAATAGTLNPSSAISIDTGAIFAVKQNGTGTQGTDFSTAAISGLGSFEQAGTGTTVFNVANTYSGSTTITAGTLQLGSGGSAGSLNTVSAITIASGATLSINRSDTVTQGTDFTGSALSGDGGFTQAGNGTTVLNTANTYTGTTTIDAGTLVADAATALGTGDVVISSGATLKVGGGTTSQELDLNGLITNAGSLQFDIFSNSSPPGPTAADADYIKFTGADRVIALKAIVITNPNSLTSANFTIGDQIQLIDWGSISLGNRDATGLAFDLSSLSGGNLFDVASGDYTNFLATGKITFAPEPSRALLTMLGLFSLVLRRRRSAR